MALPLLPTSLVGSYAAAGLADRPQEARRPLSAARARQGAVARRAGISRPGAGRRHAARHPRPGARRPRHHHRRRDAARKLFQPLRHRARRRRHRQSRHRARPLRPSQSGAARRRQDAPQASGRGATTCNSCAPTPTRTIKITVPGPFTMSQQAQNDFYKDEEEMALDYAAAVNAEIKDLFAAGADIVQIDEPYMQARPDKARKYRPEGAQRRARRRQGHDRGAHLLRLCRHHPRAAGGLFVPAGVRRTRRCSRSRSRPRSPSLDCAVLEKLPGKTIILGVLDLSDMTIETPETVAARIRRALPYVPAGAHRGRARLRAEISAARGRVRQNAGDGRGRQDRARRARR